MFTVAVGTGHVHQAVAERVGGSGSGGGSGVVLTVIVGAAIMVMLALRALISAACVLLEPVLQLVRTGAKLLVTFLLLAGIGMVLGMGVGRSGNTAAGAPPAPVTVAATA